MEREQEWLRRNGREDLAKAVRHVAVVDRDGADYDVASFELDGTDCFSEVKTTRGRADTEFLVSLNESEFSARHSASFRLYRLYDFDPDSGVGSYYVLRGSLTKDASLQLQAVQFRGDAFPRRVQTERADPQPDIILAFDRRGELRTLLQCDHRHQRRTYDRGACPSPLWLSRLV